jgi:hypothetical protein
MDAISEASTELADFTPETIDLETIVLYGFAGEPVASPASTALALSAPLPLALRERFERLSQIEQAAVLALGAALLVAGLGWAIGAAAGKAAVGAAALAI